MKNNIFVFVVCGEDKHINTLNTSLRFIKYFSSNEIIVITDLTRNSQKIEHSEIIDIKTPDLYDHHQASIFLKTSLHRYLDMSNNYCYLDSDVLAVKSDVFSIFNHFISPITFGPDHSKINQFSPYSVSCDCLKMFNLKKELLENLIQKHNPFFEYEKRFNIRARERERLVISAKNQPLKNLTFLLRYFFGVYIFPFNEFKLNAQIKYNKKGKLWLDEHGNHILYHAINYYKKIEDESNFKYKIPQFDWFDEKGIKVYELSCNHLIEKIKSKFNVEITDKKWQHWNGGVFLFNNDSKDFLESWHKSTIEIFEDPEWETRDQGTLAQTVWKFGLQNHPTLHKKFNFIADFNNPMITFDANKGFTTDNFKTIINPSFIHVYHKFGFKGWEIWDAIDNILITI